MTALQAASAGVKDMADGSLRITIEFEPRYAKDAFALFGARGTQVAIAALKDGSFLDQPPVQTAPITPNSTELKPRAHMGDCCYRTVMWCAEPTFWAFLNERNLSADTVTNAGEAAELVKFLCAIDSRKELDTDNEANKAWHRLIREPYRLYLAGRPG